MLFDSPEIKKMMEQENEFLAKGKIDWIPKILPLAERVSEYSNKPKIRNFVQVSEFVI